MRATHDGERALPVAVRVTRDGERVFLDAAHVTHVVEHGGHNGGAPLRDAGHAAFSKSTVRHDAERAFLVADDSLREAVHAAAVTYAASRHMNDAYRDRCDMRCVGSDARRDKCDAAEDVDAVARSLKCAAISRCAPRRAECPASRGIH